MKYYFFGFLKDYIEEPNAPDYTGEYPPPYELTTDDAQIILKFKNKQDKKIKKLTKIIKNIKKNIENILNDCSLNEEDYVCILYQILNDIGKVKNE